MDNQNLENRILALEKWKVEREKQQLHFPLDIFSIDILRKYFMRIIETVSWQSGAGANTFYQYIGQQDNILFDVFPLSLTSYIVNITTDYITTSQVSGNLKFFNNFEVTLRTTGTAPAPLDATLLTPYYVINSNGYTFQLSATLGGAAINITTTGTGRQFIIYQS